jgi:diadenosine tetraphosphate (Ap4A) HIT family hydrolase
MRKFGAPGTLIRAYRHWHVLLRPGQITLGSLVLASPEPARRVSALSREAFAELADVTRDIEQGLRDAFSYDKINYLLFMMVDPDVHFHVIPRYATARDFAGMTFSDPGWPGMPDMGRAHDLDAETFGRILGHIRAVWN